MTILHVLSQFEVTGAETFAAVLADEQVCRGHDVIIVSDTFHTPAAAEKKFFPIGQRSLLQRWKNIRYLRKLIKIKQVQIVHAHSRAASWVSYFATRFTSAALVSTIHGRQHIHASSKIFRVYGEKIMAVCESIRDQLIEELHYSSSAVTVVRNGIDLRRWNGAGETPFRRFHLALIGRLSGPKGKVAQAIAAEIFPEIKNRFPGAVLRIVGGMSAPEDVAAEIGRVIHKIGGESVQWTGYSDRLEKAYASAQIVIGSGRVAMEALACGAEVLALGESNYIGRVNAGTAERSLATNFGDAGKAEPLPVKNIIEDITAIFNEEHRARTSWGKEFIAENFDIAAKTGDVFTVYAEAAGIRRCIKEIPVLMYHRITGGKPAGTKHGIYVTALEFEEQLQYLQQNGFSALTFSDIHDIRNGRAVLPPKPVLLTFDDGYEDNFLFALPLLKKYRMKAVIYVIGDNTAGANFWDEKNGEPEARLLSGEQIRMMAVEGIEFGSHAMSHRRLTECSAEDIEYELAESKRSIERRLGIPILSVAYPYGSVNQLVKQKSVKTGYGYGLATDSGGYNFWGDLLQIRRIQIFPGAGMISFRKKTSGFYHRYKKVPYDIH